ncbi:MAG: UDP-glucose/GDP-mannose dehydrogenase family protein, partial [bacterium]
MKKITVIGAGYVGLVTAVCFAQKGNTVTVVEKNEQRITSLLNGQVPFYEPGLDTLLSQVIKNKKIIFVLSIKEALIQNPEIIFSCVGTPPKDDGRADLSHVFEVATQVGQYLNEYCLIINKSTVPVGTAKRVESAIKDQLELRGVDIKFDVASNPEFLKEGTALNDFLYPDRVVIGVESEKAETILKQLYAPFIENENQIVIMNRESAELTKYAANCMLATRISFMNQLALLADKVGADIADVKRGIAKDERIGPYFLNAGIGYGGSCFPKDVKALIHMGYDFDEPMTLFQVVDNINDEQRTWFVQKVLNYYGEKIKNKTIGIWGLAFKPETDDIRHAPSIDIIKKLLSFGAKIVAYDPVATENIKKIFGDKILYANKSDDVLKISDALLLLTEWKEFLIYKPTDFLKLKDKTVFDGRNCFNFQNMVSVGLNYFAVGRNS